MRFDPTGDVNFQLYKILNSGITLGDNLDGALLEFDSVEGEMEIEHNLGRTPIGYIPFFLEGDLRLWTTRVQLQAWNNATIFLQSSATSRMVRLFVM